MKTRFALVSYTVIVILAIAFYWLLGGRFGYLTSRDFFKALYALFVGWLVVCVAVGTFFSWQFWTRREDL